MNAGVLCTLVVVAAILFAVALQALVDRYVHSDTLAAAQKIIADHFIQTVGGLFGVLAAFLLAGALASFQAIRSDLTVELNALIDLARIAPHLAAPAGEEIGTAVREYARSVVEDELPNLATGNASPLTTAALSQLWDRTASFHPATAGETNLHAQALDLIRTISEQRRILALTARRSIPALVWWILGIGGVITVAMVTLSAPPPRRLRFALVASMSVLIALTLYTLYALSHPFGPALSVVDPQRLSELRALLAPQL